MDFVFCTKPSKVPKLSNKPTLAKISECNLQYIIKAFQPNNQFSYKIDGL